MLDASDFVDATGVVDASDALDAPVVVDASGIVAADAADPDGAADAMCEVAPMGAIDVVELPDAEAVLEAKLEANMDAIDTVVGDAPAVADSAGADASTWTLRIESSTIELQATLGNAQGKLRGTPTAMGAVGAPEPPDPKDARHANGDIADAIIVGDVSGVADSADADPKDVASATVRAGVLEAPDAPDPPDAAHRTAMKRRSSADTAQPIAAAGTRTLYRLASSRGSQEVCGPHGFAHLVRRPRCFALSACGPG